MILMLILFHYRELALHLSSTGNYTFYIHIPLSFSLPTLYRELALHQNIDVGIVPLVHYHELAMHQTLVFYFINVEDAMKTTERSFYCDCLQLWKFSSMY